jgi:DUF971 family protein/molybdopterin converting factor small subunit
MELHTPVEIRLHTKSRLLEIEFSTGENFKLSAEYLRTHAKSAEIKTSEIPVAGKADVNIEKIEPQGTYGLRLFFDDAYDSGIYSWDTLFELGENYDSYWQDYLDALEKHHLTRGKRSNSDTGTIRLKLLYFMDRLLKITKKEEEELELPEEISKVEDLLALLRKRGFAWKRAFGEDSIQVTVNKEFAELFTVLEDGDEIAFVPKPK